MSGYWWVAEHCGVVHSGVCRKGSRHLIHTEREFIMSAAVPTGYRQTFVTLEGELRLPAFLQVEGRRTWNGFEMPLFDAAIFEVEENREILAKMFPEDTDESLRLSWVGTSPVVMDPEDGYDYVRVGLDGLLQIGSGAFVWSEWEAEDEEEADEVEAPAPVEAPVQPLLQDAVKALNEALEERGLVGFDGEAVDYLEALLIMSQGHTVEDAVVTVYGAAGISKAGA